jgi:hypothetical protein
MIYRYQTNWDIESIDFWESSIEILLKIVHKIECMHHTLLHMVLKRKQVLNLQQFYL